jgi:hypothetical protein
MSHAMSSTDNPPEEGCELLPERTVMSTFSAGPAVRSGQAFLISGSNSSHDAQQCTPTNTVPGALTTTVFSSCQTVADTDHDIA